MAVAHAVLQHLVQITRCKTLFITHYPQVAMGLEKKYPEKIANLHVTFLLPLRPYSISLQMGYQAVDRIDGTQDIIFLYKLSPGIATASFGIECGRLAGLPETILNVAARRSSEMQAIIQTRWKRNM
jgi:DNA mismatch repair protein MSH3